MERNRRAVRDGKSTEEKVCKGVGNLLTDRHITVSFERVVQVRQYEPLKTKIIVGGTVPDGESLDDAHAQLSTWAMRRARRDVNKALRYFSNET